MLKSLKCAEQKQDALPFSFSSREHAMNALDAIRKLVDPHGVKYAKEDGLRTLGFPSQDELVTTALEGLDSDDRNVRVLMLRLLGQLGGERAASGILKGLSDAKRRVREVAVKSSLMFLDCPGVTERIDVIAGDENEINRVRDRACNVLAQYCRQKHLPPTQGMLEYAGVRQLKHIREHKTDELRLKALWSLLQLDLSEAVAGALQTVVKNGSRTEAILATRALSGLRVVNVNHVADPTERSGIIKDCEPAGGGVFYWVRRE